MDHISGSSPIPFKVAITHFNGLTFPDFASLESLHHKDSRVFSVIGVASKHARELLGSGVSRVSGCIAADGVVGLSIGLDFTVRPSEHHCQVRVVENILRYIRDFDVKKTLVLTCYDLDSSSKAFETLYSLCVSSLGPFHPIHFSCFLYSSEQFLKWSRYFHNTSFGFCPSIFNHWSKVSSVVKLVPIHSFLVQSCFPSFSGASNNSSIVPVLGLIAKSRGIGFKEFVALVYQNSLRVYNISLQ